MGLIPSMQTILSWIPAFIPARAYPPLRTALLYCLKAGPLPQHIGFIMDGNRRFSRAAGIDVKEGHEQGFEALKRVLELMLRLEIPHVTVYAFAIDNFKRSPTEVEKLMELARVRLVEICEKGMLLEKYGVRLCIIGRTDLLPPDVQASCAKAEAMTAHNTRACLNVAFPYASQEEIATAVRRSIRATIDANMPPSSITTEMISSHLYTAHSPPVDIIVRTSGVHRLSDFLLWQASGSTEPSASPRERAGAAIHFVPKYWPDFGLLDVLPILLGWQSEAIFANAEDMLGRLWRPKSKED